MPFIGELEPRSLLNAFLRHPPDDFEAFRSVDGTPAFTARFDLLTTADADLQHHVRALPMHNRWKRLLTPRTRFIGATVTEYAWLPSAREAGALARQLATEHAAAHPLLIIKDIPDSSPLLDAHDNAWIDTFVAACRAAGFVLLEGQALAWVPIDFSDEDAYLARLSRGARRNIRRKLRSRAQLEVQTLMTGSAAFQDPALLAACFDLYEQVFNQSEIHFDHLSADFFRTVLQDGDSGGVVFVYRHEGRMIGWNLCYEHGNALVDKYIGFAYPDAHQNNLYAVSWMQNLAYARKRGLQRYIAGWTDPEVKAHLGARFTFTRHAVRPRSRLLRFALRLLARRFESDRQWFEERTARASSRS